MDGRGEVFRSKAFQLIHLLGSAAIMDDRINHVRPWMAAVEFVSPGPFS